MKAAAKGGGEGKTALLAWVHRGNQGSRGRWAVAYLI